MSSQFLSQIKSKNNIASKKYYFMAGLPRSGSTLLSSILNQNPNFYSGPSSPVLSAMYCLEDHFANNELYHGFPKPNQVHLMISRIIDQFYSDISKPIVFDKNRAWPGRIPYIENYIDKKPKIICPVRDVSEILTSIITMIHRNPYKEGNPRINFVDEQLVKMNIPINDDNRCEFVAGPNGILGQSLNTIFDSIQDGHRNKMHFVEYVDLVTHPQKTLKQIYDFLGEEYFEHTFDALENINRENDINTYGISDMHEVRSKLKITSKDPKKVLSQNILDKCQGIDFWRN